MFFHSKKYKVSLKGRSEIIYLEGKRKAQIEAEMMTGTTDLVIYFDTFYSWQPPFQDETISAEDRRRIKLNISNELISKGLKIEWE